MSERMDVYFNLNKGGYSIRDRRTNRVTNKAEPCPVVHLAEVEFKVSLSGLARTLREKRRRVHAWAVGLVVTGAVDVSRATVPIRYNPFVRGEFYRMDTGERVERAKLVVFTTSETGTARMMAEL